MKRELQSEGIRTPHLSKDFLNLQFKELSFLCMNYDPYEKNLSDEIQRLLHKYHLIDIDDPFMITNRLLRMLDQVETQLKSLKDL